MSSNGQHIRSQHTYLPLFTNLSHPEVLQTLYDNIPETYFGTEYRQSSRRGAMYLTKSFIFTTAIRIGFFWE
jgi:hypothetical protein